MFGALEKLQAGEEPSVNGVWQLADAKADEKARQSAIDLAMEKVPRLARSRASKALLTGTKPTSKLTVEDRGDRFLIADPKQQLNLVIGGKPVEVDNENEKVQLSCVRKDQLLVVTAKSTKATRSTLYRPSSDGKTLVLEVALTIPRLGTTARYKTKYVRP